MLCCKSADPTFYHGNNYSHSLGLMEAFGKIKKTMSIRMIAKELYLLHQKVESLEQQIENSPPQDRDELKDRLRQLKAERNRMRKALEGLKD